MLSGCWVATEKFGCWGRNGIFLLLKTKKILLKDTLKAFKDFKNKKKKVCKVMFLICKSMFWKCIEYTIHWDKPHKKISFGENQRHEKCPLFSFTSSISSQFYFWFAILICAEAQSSSLQNCDFDSISFLLKFIFWFNNMHELSDFKIS